MCDLWALCALIVLLILCLCPLYLLTHSLLILFVYSLFLILFFLFLLVVPVYSQVISLMRLGGRCRSKNNAQLARPRQCHFATGRRLAIWTCHFGLAEVSGGLVILSFRLQNSNAVCTQEPYHF